MEITYLRGYGPKAWQAKRYVREPDGSVTKDSDIMYTKQWQSKRHTVDTPEQLLESMRTHSAKGWAAFTGYFTHDLSREMRKGNVSSEPQQFLCIDIDGGPYRSVHEFMTDPYIPEPLRNTKCVVVYSNSYMLAKDGLAAHLFYILDKPTASSVLKQVLTNLNFLTPRVADWLMAQPLPEGKTDLPLPIDPTMGQGNRIIYNAPPVVVNMDDPIPNLADRIWLYAPQKSTDKLSLSDITFAAHRRASSSAEMIARIRKSRSLTIPATVNGREVDIDYADAEWQITDVQRDSDEFIRCNVNGTKRSPWFFRNGEIDERTMMYSQNPADIPFYIMRKAPSFAQWWNGTDDVMGEWARQELGLCGKVSGIPENLPSFMLKYYKDDV